MKDIIYIHGGEVFSSKEEYYKYLQNKNIYLEGVESWISNIKKYITENELDLRILSPKMPCKENASFEAWKIFFDHYLDIVKENNINNVSFIAYSLGAIFLLKYLSFHKVDLVIEKLYIVASPYSEKIDGDFLADFDLDKIDLRELLKLQNLNEKQLYFFHSKDDFVVDYKHCLEIQKYFPEANYQIFEDRNHFLQSEFPELLNELLK